MRVAARLIVAGVVLAAVLTPRSRPLAREKWDPVDPKELALTTPQVEKNADAEVLLWDVRVSDKFVGRYIQTVWHHYLRIKIYTDRGRESEGRVDIPHMASARVHDVQARSIARNGTFVELKNSDVFERDLIKAGGIKIRATSFVLPSVETGGIIEYRWQEVHDDAVSHNLRLPLCRNIPVQLVRYHISPLDPGGVSLPMRGMPFHATPTPLQQEFRATGAFVMTSLSDVPAFREEPHAPSEWDLKPWLLIYYYSRSDPDDPTLFWRKFGRAAWDADRKATAPTSEIRQAAASLNVASATLDEKIEKVLELCRAKIKRVDVDTISEAERRGFDGNKSATEALTKGRGTAADIGVLFVAMARALGLDARIAALPSRNDAAFDPTMMLPQMLTHRVVAIRDGGSWRYVDPANVYAPAGHLAWTEELATVLVPDEREPVGGRTDAAPPEWSTKTSTASLRLAGDGSIEGDVSAEYTGHLDMTLKEQEDHLAPAEREKVLKDQMTERLPGAELSAVTIENVTAVGKPYTRRFHLKVPGYAQLTGSRLFVQPAILEKGVPPLFPSAQRRYPVSFDHTWREVERVTIELPAGYDVESLEAPGPVSMQTIGTYRMTISRVPEGNAVTMTREFSFGAGARLLFPATGYPSLKAYFDAVARADAYTLTVRRSTSGGGK